MLTHRIIIPALTLMLLGLWADGALAQSSLGIGRSQQAIAPDGMFAGFFFWVQQQQQAFYKAMTGALKVMREDASQVWYLVALSFAYGIFHAAGPGHGKAVVSSYMLANEVSAKRGIMLSFASSFLQGVTAIVAISALLLFLRGTGVRTDNLAGTLEIASYFLVMVLGAWLLWVKMTGRGHHHHHGNDHDHAHDSSCGHLHAPDPKQLTGDLGLRQAWSAILAVGLRPCSGAIIVLTFAFLNGLVWGGILSTFAMSLGTGITVATLALLAVYAKNTALKVAGMQDRAGQLHKIIEICGAALVFILGAVLFTAALSV